MENWKALLNYIYPGAEIAAPGESVPYVEPPKVPDPLGRIHLMRKIKSNTSGFARLYGAKDLEQFHRQMAYMLDFGCTEGRLAEIAFNEQMPVYADMSVAQLQCYFRWRTKIRRGTWEPTAYAYVLLYLFELLSFENNEAALAEAWLVLREYYPKLDANLRVWFKDYYLRYDRSTPFRALAHELNLEAFYPAQQTADEKSVLRHSSYNYRESRLLQERPALLAVLEQAIEALLRNLAPLFRLYALPMEGLLYLQPTRFTHYELFRDAAVYVPSHGKNREVKLSPSEHYRLQSGNWSRAMEDAFRPPSHGVGYLVKRAEARLRELAGYRPFNESGDPSHLLERWAHSGGFRPQFFDMVEDSRFSAIIDECVGAAWEGAPSDGLLSQAAAIARELDTEPMKTILCLGDISSANTKLQFQKQGMLLATLEDRYTQRIACQLKAPAYAELSHGQLRTYLTWRSQWRLGKAVPTQTAYATLYCSELLSGIGTTDPFKDLCRFLREYAAVHDRGLAKRLSGWLKDFYVLHQMQDNYAKLAKENCVELWFPQYFLCTEDPQLLLFDQISTYKISKSRFYDTKKQGVFEACFRDVLTAVTEILCETGVDLAAVLYETRRQVPWAPWRGLPIQHPKCPRAGTVVALGGGERYMSTGREWVCLMRPELPAWAAAFAAFLLKRMEQGLRLRANYPYPLSVHTQALENAVKHHKQLLKALLEQTLANAIDGAVARFTQANDVSLLRVQKPKPRIITGITTGIPQKAPVVIVDFSQLERIRGEAREITEHLTVEPEEAEAAVEETARETGGGWDDFYDALNEAQTSCINALSAGGLCKNDALFLEEINELSLEYIGDNLIDTTEDTAYIYEEYVSKWREHG